MTVSEKAASSTSISDDMSLNLAVLGYTCIHTRALTHALLALAEQSMLHQMMAAQQVTSSQR